MAFTSILPQIVNIAKKAANPIKSAVTSTSTNSIKNIPTPLGFPTLSNLPGPPSSTVSSGSLNTDPPSSAVGTTTGGTANSDLRIRISMPPGSPNIFYKDGNNLLLAPLYNTNGFIFPIQPDITMAHSAEYQTTKPTHSNFPYYHYTNSEIQQLSITGEFPIRTVYDAQYVNAGIHFLRSCTRMFNGRDAELAGAPPMVLRLTGLGFGIFDNIPVVISSVNVTYPSSVDFLTFKPFVALTETAKFPTNLTIQVSLNPVFSRDYISNQYSTLNYSKGVGLLGTTRPLDGLIKFVPPELPLPPSLPPAPPTSIKDLPLAVGLTGTLPSTLTGKVLTDAEVNDYYAQIAEQGSIANLPPPPSQQTGVSTSGPKIPGSPAGFGASTTPNI